MVVMEGALRLDPWRGLLVLTFLRISLGNLIINNSLS